LLGGIVFVDEYRKTAQVDRVYDTKPPILINNRNFLQLHLFSRSVCRRGFVWDTTYVSDVGLVVGPFILNSREAAEDTICTKCFGSQTPPATWHTESKHGSSVENISRKKHGHG